jgi:hypothetical protein
MQWYHFQADLIQPDDTFKKLIKNPELYYK